MKILQRSKTPETLKMAIFFIIFFILSKIVARNLPKMQRKSFFQDSKEIVLRKKKSKIIFQRSNTPKTLINGPFSIIFPFQVNRSPEICQKMLTKSLLLGSQRKSIKKQSLRTFFMGLRPLNPQKWLFFHYSSILSKQAARNLPKNVNQNLSFGIPKEMY